jgi:hypothetical protein
MVLAHARALKTGAGATVIRADLHEPDTILGHPDARRLIDFAQPVAVLFVAVLHFVGGLDAHAAVARFISAAVPGSYLVLSHVTAEEENPQAATGTAVYASTSNPIFARPRAKIPEFFDGLRILEPGLVPVAQWRPRRPWSGRPEQGAGRPGPTRRRRPQTGVTMLSQLARNCAVAVGILRSGPAARVTDLDVICYCGIRVSSAMTEVQAERSRLNGSPCQPGTLRRPARDHCFPECGEPIGLSASGCTEVSVPASYVATSRIRLCS